MIQPFLNGAILSRAFIGPGKTRPLEAEVQEATFVHTVFKGHYPSFI